MAELKCAKCFYNCLVIVPVLGLTSTLSQNSSYDAVNKCPHQTMHHKSTTYQQKSAQKINYAIEQTVTGNT
jgi:hypothetical protein